MRINVTGFTLVELVITLSIVLIVLLFGVSNMEKFLLRQKMTSQLNTFVSLQRLARQTAIFKNSMITLCASRDGLSCLSRKYWRDGVLVFIDRNANRIIDKEDKVVKFHKSEFKGLNITWRAYQNKSYLQFKSDGWTNNQNGTFRFCFVDKSAQYNRALIINRSGRARLSTDSNGDGVHDGADGKNIVC